MYSSSELKERLPTVSIDSTECVPRWYFGGLASIGAACITHPLDTMKVYYQTTGSLSGNQSLISATARVIKTNGFMALYNGLSASILRQMTYSTSRFAIYEVTKQKLCTGKETPPFYKLFVIAALSGAVGGVVGAPADLVNVRMQNDIKLPTKLKRNYNNAIHGLTMIIQNEGIGALFRGCSMAVARAMLVSVGQLAMYDQIKSFLVNYISMHNDKIRTHITASIFTSIICTTITQPVDVLKTRMMNQCGKGNKPNILIVVADLYKSSGVTGFFKGFVPAMVRLGPHTVLVYIFYEQLRIHYGHPTL